MSHNITIKQGDTYTAGFVLSSSSTGLPFNLTGYSAKGAVRDRWGGDILAHFTMSGQFNTSGSFTASLSANDTEAMIAGNGVYDVKIVTGSLVTTISEGIAIIKPTAVL